MTFRSICFICNEYPPCANGGIGTFTKEIAEALVIQGVDVYIVGFYSDIATEQYELINGVNIYRLPSNSTMLGSFINRIDLYNKAKWLIRQFNIQIVEAYDFSGLTAFWPKLPVPLICRLHGSIYYFYDEMGVKGLKPEIWKIIEGKALRNYKNIISVSQYTANRTLDLFETNANIEVIYNGVSGLRVESNYASKLEGENHFKVIFAGSVIKKKGVLQLANAWKHVIKNNPHAHLYIVGKDTEQRVNEIKAILSNELNSISYLGLMPKDELIGLYQEMDLAVFPSYSEAFSLAPMEAMKEGLPVIYTKRASGHELIDEGIDGLLVEPDDINELAGKINKVITMNPEERQAMAELGKNKIYNMFNFDKTVACNIDYYQRVLDAK